MAGLLLKWGWRRRRRDRRRAVIDIQIGIAGTAVAAGRGEVGGQTRKVRHDGSSVEQTRFGTQPQADWSSITRMGRRAKMNNQE